MRKARVWGQEPGAEQRRIVTWAFSWLAKDIPPLGNMGFRNLVSGLHFGLL
jgi:hypothetical protein